MRAKVEIYRNDGTKLLEFQFDPLECFRWTAELGGEIIDDDLRYALERIDFVPLMKRVKPIDK